MDYCIGIDLGTTNSCVAYWTKENHVEIIPNELGNRTTPSWVAFTDSERLVGEAAKDQASGNPQNTIFDVKRLMGKKFSSLDEIMEYLPYTITDDSLDMPLIEINSKKYKPEEISAAILSKMKKIAEDYIGEPVKKAVITVPAYFNDAQRQATKDAAVIAGLDCLRIINEPTAACLCYGLNKKDISNVLIFDFGGGTLDVSLLALNAGIFEVLATSGDSQLGGEDIDDILMKHFIDEINKKHKIQLTGNDHKIIRKLKTACEKIKRDLSMTTTATIDLDIKGVDFTSKITRSSFEKLCKPIFDRCIIPIDNVMADSGLDKTSIDQIVLVGGSTRIPKIQELLKEYFPGVEINKSVNPDEAVAYGAAVQGAILCADKENNTTKDILLLDVNPLSFGIETVGGIMAKIINRNSTIPCKKTSVFSTPTDNQTSVLIQIFEGEREFTKDNNLLGTFELSGIPKAPRGVPKIEVTFDIDSNGILNVTAYDKNTGLSNQITLTQDSGRLNQEQINKMIEDAEKFKIRDELKKQEIDFINGFEKYLNNIQIQVNDKELNKNLSADEISIINQYILEKSNWLIENQDLSLDELKECRQTTEYDLKDYMYKLYSRPSIKKQKITIVPKNKSAEPETPAKPVKIVKSKKKTDSDVQKLLNNLFGDS